VFITDHVAPAICVPGKTRRVTVQLTSVHVMGNGMYTTV